MQPYELKPDAIEQPLIAGQARVKHFLRPPSQADWEIYDVALKVALERSEEGTALLHEEMAAADVLWRRIILRVEGYEACEDWRDKIPLSHRRAAILPLTQVVSAAEREGDPDAPFQLAVDRIEVELLAAPDYEGLAHVFRFPNPQDEMEFDRIRSAAVWVRGTTRSAFPAKLAAYVKLYDRLIIEVRNYTLNGEIPSREQAVQLMDAMHKQIALIGLFARGAAENAGH
jgi:hypothetical protein